MLHVAKIITFKHSHTIYSPDSAPFSFCKGGTHDTDT